MARKLSLTVKIEGFSEALQHNKGNYVSVEHKDEIRKKG